MQFHFFPYFVSSRSFDTSKIPLWPLHNCITVSVSRLKLWIIISMFSLDQYNVVSRYSLRTISLDETNYLVDESNYSEDPRILVNATYVVNKNSGAFRSHCLSDYFQHFYLSPFFLSFSKEILISFNIHENFFERNFLSISFPVEIVESNNRGIIFKK